MFKALHPTDNKLITYQDYKEFLLDNGYSTSQNAPKSRCPVCKQDMGDRAGHTQANGHFYHLSNEFCPTKKPSSRPYLGLKNNNPDEGAMETNKKFVKDNLKLIYKRLSEIIPYFNLLEFIDILKEAKRLNAYGYVNLNPEAMPYMFVTLINFLPKKGFKRQGENKSKRSLTFCFFYNDAVQSYSDLWIDEGLNFDLVRISYSNGATRKVTSIETTNDYLNGDPKPLSEKQVKWCLEQV